MLQQHHNREEGTGEEVYIAGEGELRVSRAPCLTGCRLRICRRPAVHADASSADGMHRRDALPLRVRPAPTPAAIVGPYDRRNSGAQSSLTWFYVDHEKGKIPEAGQSPLEAGCTAKALQVRAAGQAACASQAGGAFLLDVPSSA